MNDYLHHVSGFFAHRKQAEGVFSRLVEQGLPRERLHIFTADAAASDAAASDAAASDAAPNEGSNGVLQDVIVDGSIGAAVGTGIGALGSVALAVANVSLFIASPLIAPLVMMGWGASIGGLVGATAGAASGDPAGTEKKEGWFSDLVGDAIASGQVVLVAQTLTTQETAIAREVIQASVGDAQDTNMA